MRIIHEPSDDAILAAWTYFGHWRKSRNALLLLDALAKLELAERLWIADRGKTAPLRREWQALRRCVTLGLVRVRLNLLAAHSPAETERALYRTGKRATLARRDQLDGEAIAIALAGSTLDQAAEILARWGIERTSGYLKRRASVLGLTRRAKRSRGPAASKRAEIVEISPSHRRHRAVKY